jgi:hypothetical protein
MQTSLTSLAPWSWQPSPKAWYEVVERLGAVWAPSEALQLNIQPIRSALSEAVGNQADWLMHPSLTALTNPTAGSKLQQDFQLAVWITAHTDIAVGAVTIPNSLWMWSRGGDILVQPGRHELSELVQSAIEDDYPIGMALDIWSRLPGETQSNSWATLDELTEAHQPQLNHEIFLFMQSIAWLERFLPELAAWAETVTQVVIPLHSPGGKEFRSGSTANVPGLIYMDLFGGTEQILEAVIHESAHHYLYLEEVCGSLIDPQCTDYFDSPLRPEPRPLRGILMAYHALSFICAFYLDAIRLQAPFSERLQVERTPMLAKLESGEQALLQNKHHLTSRGRTFLDKTMEVAHYARI